jgi:hypothetical protein
MITTIAEEIELEDACERCGGEGAHPWPDFRGVWGLRRMRGEAPERER